MNVWLLVLVVAILMVVVIAVRRLMSHLTEDFDDAAWLDRKPWDSVTQSSDLEVRVSRSLRVRALLLPTVRLAFDLLLTAALLVTIAVDVRTHSVTVWTYVSWALVVYTLANGALWASATLRLARRLRLGHVLFATRPDGIQFGDLIIPWSSVSRVGANANDGNVYVRYVSSGDDVARPIGCRIERATEGLERLLACEKMRTVTGRAVSRNIARAIADRASLNKVKVRALASIRDDVTFTWMTDPSLPDDRFTVD